MIWVLAWFYLHAGLAIGPYTSEEECWAVRKQHVLEGRAPHAGMCVQGWDERGLVSFESRALTTTLAPSAPARP
jgi:hypothetical protein